MGESRRFSGKVAVVTGAGSGIGAAIAERFAAEGSRVVMVDVDARSQEHVAKRIRDVGGECATVEGDVAEPEVWSGLSRVEVAEGIDILVANASRQTVMPAHDLALDDWDDELAVNLRSLYLAFRAFRSLWRPGASAVVITSVHASFGLAQHSAYAASKGGMMALTRQLAVEYGPDVRVNAVVPGPILTPRWDLVPDHDRSGALERTVLGRFGMPDEVAAAAAFLASDDASFITGASLVVDGGWSVNGDAA